MHCLGLDSEGQHCCNGSVFIKLLKDLNEMHVFLIQKGPVCNGSSIHGSLCLTR